MSRKVILLVLVWIGMPFLLYAQKENLSEFTEKFVNRSELVHAVTSISVIDIDSDEIVAENLGKKVLVPASSLKLLTTYTALEALGSEYRYSTALAYSGKILDDGTLEGDVYIIGSGDPTLGSSKSVSTHNFQELLGIWVRAIKDKGITCIAGDVIADESIFNSFPISPTWQWNDLGNYYASGAWGINIHDNQYYVYFKQQPKKGDIPKLDGYGPHIPGLELQNEVSTGEKGSGDNAYIFGGPYDYTKRIVGTIPPGAGKFTIKGSVPDPPKFAAYHLQQRLKQNKIKVEGYRAEFLKSKMARKKTLLHTVESPILSDIVRLANLESNNLMCEALLKTLGYELQKKGSGEYGKKIVKRYLDQLSVDYKSLLFEDGSGLSARNRCSSYFLASYLKAIATSKGTDYVTQYLARGGMEGTAASMFAGSSAAGSIWIKSGSMENIMSYTGIVKSRSGRNLSFSIIVNGHNLKNRAMRKILEQYMTAIYKLS